MNSSELKQGISRNSRRGLEVGLIGIDGTGKSSIAAELSRCEVPMKVVYMGRRGFHPLVIRLFRRRVFGISLWRLGMHYEFLMRRLGGWIMARRGYIVIYDRHPLEHLLSTPSRARHRISNWLNHLYNWPMDLNFYLYGDYEALYRRKNEWSIPQLVLMDTQIRGFLQTKNLPVQSINVTELSLPSVICLVAARISRESGYQIRPDLWAEMKPDGGLLSV